MGSYTGLNNIAEYLEEQKAEITLAQPDAVLTLSFAVEDLASHKPENLSLLTGNEAVNAMTKLHAGAPVRGVIAESIVVAAKTGKTATVQRLLEFDVVKEASKYPDIEQALTIARQIMAIDKNGQAASATPEEAAKVKASGQEQGQTR